MAAVKELQVLTLSALNLIGGRSFIEDLSNLFNLSND